MAKKDKGWDYLNSDDINIMSDGSEGDYGATSSDGSGYYYGADGSYGSKSSDGSGYYYGADGSYGSKSSDGSGYYYGADGSYGDMYSDGSSSYHGADGEDFYFDGDNEEEKFDADDNGTLGSAIGTLIGALIVGKAINAAASRKENSATRAERKRQKAVARKEQERQEEAERQARERELQEERARNKEKRKAWTKKHLKGIIIANVIFVMVLIFGIGFYEYQLLTPMRYSNSKLEGTEYTSVVQKLNDAGFSNIRIKNVSDLIGAKEAEEGLVTEVNLFWTDSFNADMNYPSNMPITVVYHTIKMCSVPLASKKVKGMDYLEIKDEFKNAGFTNVSVQAKYDIVSGLFSEDGEVASVTIDGEKKFASGDEFRSDAEIIVTYHTLRKNKKK